MLDLAGAERHEASRSITYVVDGWLIVTKPKQGVVFTLEDTREMILAAKPSKGRWARLAYLDGVEGATKEARAYILAPEDPPGLCAVALVTVSAFQRVMANFMLRPRQGPYPVKCFSAEDEALQWLAEIVGMDPRKNG